MIKTDAFSKKRILFLDEIDKKYMIHRMCQAFDADGVLTDATAFEEAIYQREAEYSTYVGHGVAIPHAISESVRSAGICFLKSEKGVVYGTTDELVHLAFMLAVPADSAQHLNLLSIVARNLMHQEFRTSLMEAKTIEEAHDTLMQMLDSPK